MRARQPPGPLRGRAVPFAEEPGRPGHPLPDPACGSLRRVTPVPPYRPALADRHLRLAGTRNLRDVGGYPAGDGRRTRWRTLYRTDALDQLPAASQVAFRDLGVRQMIDVRWGHEVDARPSVFHGSDRVRYRNLPLMPDQAVPEGIAATYRHMYDTRSAALATIARALVEPDGLPAVIGCAAGVDRTGVTVGLLLSAVGVPADVVAEDYALSVDSFAGDGRGSGLEDWRGGSITLDCRPEYMLEALDHLERVHGGAAALLEREGFGAADLDRLRELLTERTTADVPG
jgi:protein-tyrosine phosphatase